MNRLKRLFSPRALATTIATGLLFASTTLSLAGWFTVSTVGNVPSMCQTTYCLAYCEHWEGGGPRYWCCGNPSASCPDNHNGFLASCAPDEEPRGWCDDGL